METTQKTGLTPAEIESQLASLETAFAESLASADTLASLEQLRVDFLGRKSPLNSIRKEISQLAPDIRPAVGAKANETSEKLTQQFEAKLSDLKQQALNEQLQKETIDVTLPGRVTPRGARHPLTIVTSQILDIFHGLGYNNIDDNLCPEVETEYYNFDALNFAPDHPAKDMQDTFFTTVGPQVLLRSQTSTSQIRYMENNQPPIKVVYSGRVYRNEAVSSRKSVLFHQIEGLCIAEKVTLADLKGTLNAFITQFFGGKPRNTRMRGSYFPFTEPSVEVDVECILCEGKGCRTCGHSGWLEILGAGMVHPNVLKSCGIDTTQYQGFAFGMGVERMAMLKYAIQDIRLFYQNDVRFLSQFKGL